MHSSSSLHLTHSSSSLRLMHSRRVWPPSLPVDTVLPRQRRHAEPGPLLQLRRTGSTPVAAVPRRGRQAPPGSSSSGLVAEPASWRRRLAYPTAADPGGGARPAEQDTADAASTSTQTAGRARRARRGRRIRRRQANGLGGPFLFLIFYLISRDGQHNRLAK